MFPTTGKETEALNDRNYPWACRQKARVETEFYFLIRLAVTRYSFCSHSLSCVPAGCNFTHVAHLQQRKVKMRIKGHNLTESQDHIYFINTSQNTHISDTHTYCSLSSLSELCSIPFHRFTGVYFTVSSWLNSLLVFGVTLRTTKQSKYMFICAYVWIK